MNFTDYELIDSGNFEKLERFGQYILARPEPQALWDKSLSNEEWHETAHAYFELNKQNNLDSLERGEWKLKKGMPQQWFVNYSHKSMDLKMRLGLTSFKHVGLFPEQAENWNYIYDTIKTFHSTDINVLNLFAYTGGASLVARAAGASVTHVDSVKQVVTWSRENMEASKLDNIRWIVEDAFKFVQREARRGNKYNGIVLDPPAYGRGPEGEKWVLEKSINDLLKLCQKLLKERDSFVLLNLYSMGFSQLIAQNLLSTIFHPNNEPETAELFIVDKAGRKLPLGVYSRFKI
jgi:23S rRNA (cytosine1962-C5)-methyltransferase